MYRLKQLTLLLGDLSAMYLGLLFALALRHLELHKQVMTNLIAPMTILFLFAGLLMFIAGLYDVGPSKNDKKLYQRILLTALIWLVMGMLYFYINPDEKVSPKTILVLTTVIGFSLVAVWRYTYNRFISASVWQLNVVFAGITPEIKELIKIIRKEPQFGYKVKGIITDDFSITQEFPDIYIGSSLAEINSASVSTPNVIVLSPTMEDKVAILKDLYNGLFQQISVVSLANFYEEIMGRIPPFTFSEGWFIGNLQEQKKKIYDRLWLIVDYLSALIIGAFFLIVLAPVALAIKLNSHGPLFFKQKRVGKLGKTFYLYKLRTMKVLSADGSAEIHGPQFADKKDARITKVGSILRKTRLDEIPQFINILKGEMSIIGPRPERPEFVDPIIQQMPYYALRHLVKPGVTGWAQIRHGYTGSLDENLRKLEYDLYYIKNRGPLLDIGIILRTINIVVRMAGR
ncbi:MAG: sugar transferase [bacterium]